jgi:mutator protein MutT
MRALITSIFAVLCLNIPLSAQQVFEEKPKNFDPKIEVAACFIRVGEEVLFLKRLPQKPQGNTWGIPGGKFDEGETAEETVIREIREETGINMKEQSLGYYGKYYVRYPNMDYVFHIFEYRSEDFPKVKFNPKEHADYRWVTLQEALQMTLIPGEEECISLVYGIDDANLKDMS